MFWFFFNVGAYHISSTHTRHNWSLRLSVGGVALLPTYLGLPSSLLSTVKLTQCVCLWFACHLKRWSLFFDPFWRLQPPASCDVTQKKNCEV